MPVNDLINELLDVGSQIKKLYLEEAFERPTVDVLKDIMRLWHLFRSNAKRLRSAGIQQEELYFTTQRYVGRFHWILRDHYFKDLQLDTFLRNLETFKNVLQEIRENLEKYIYPEIMLQDIKLRYKLIQCNFENAHAVINEEDHENYKEVISLYFNTFNTLNDQINKLNDDPTLANRSNSNQNICNDWSAYDASMSPTDKAHQDQWMDNYIEKRLNHPHLNSNDSDNIRNLINSIYSCVKHEIKLGFDIHFLQRFIARVVKRKINNKDLYQYENYFDFTKEFKTLHDVLDFLRYMIRKCQRAMGNFSNHYDFNSFQSYAVYAQQETFRDQLIELEDDINNEHELPHKYHFAKYQKSEQRKWARAGYPYDFPSTSTAAQQETFRDQLIELEDDINNEHELPHKYHFAKYQNSEQRKWARAGYPYDFPSTSTAAQQETFRDQLIEQEDDINNEHEMPHKYHCAKYQKFEQQNWARADYPYDVPSTSLAAQRFRANTERIIN